jgi:DNA repair ATPase RecN
MSENKKTADYETRLTEAQREVEAAADNLERAADQLEGALRIGADDGAMETLNHRLQAARRRNMAAQPPPCGPGAERRG